MVHILVYLKVTRLKELVIAQAQVRNEVTDSAAVELLMELDKMKNTFVLMKN